MQKRIISFISVVLIILSALSACDVEIHFNGDSSSSITSSSSIASTQSSNQSSINIPELDENEYILTLDYTNAPSITENYFTTQIDGLNWVYSGAYSSNEDEHVNLYKSGYFTNNRLIVLCRLQESKPRISEILKVWKFFLTRD